MARQTTGEYLGEQAFFQGLSQDALEDLARYARRREVAKGDVLFAHDKPADHFYLVVEGSVSVEVASLEGPNLELQRLGPGEILGWSWLIPPYRWAFQARAGEDGEVLEFDGKAIRERCEDEPRFGYEILKRFSGLMSERLSFAREKMMEEWHPEGFA